MYISIRSELAKNFRLKASIDVVQKVKMDDKSRYKLQDIQKKIGDDIGAGRKQTRQGSSQVGGANCSFVKGSGPPRNITAANL